MKKSFYLVIALIPFLLLGCTEKKTPPILFFCLPMTSDGMPWDVPGILQMIIQNI